MHVPFLRIFLADLFLFRGEHSSIPLLLFPFDPEGKAKPFLLSLGGWQSQALVVRMAREEGRRRRGILMEKVPSCRARRRGTQNGDLAIHGENLFFFYLLR